jgi:SOS response regulatory protein OraA/RecX
MNFWTWLTSYWWIIFIFVLMFGGGVATLAKYLFGQWKAMHLRKHEAELKMELIAKGFSADEIVRVIQASAVPVSQDEENPARDSAGDAKAEFIGFLSEQKVAAEGIERIMRALNESNGAEDLQSRISAARMLVEQRMDSGDIERVIRSFNKLPIAEKPPGAAEPAFKA